MSSKKPRSKRLFVERLEDRCLLSGLSYSTYLGGSLRDAGESMAVDALGNSYVVGGTSSADFPATAGAWDATANGDSDAFVAKFDAGGALVYATFLGGSGYDYAHGIAVDALGNAYVTGETFSTDFPTTVGAFDTSYNGGANGRGDAFVVKLDATGSTLLYATFLGGSGGDSGESIAVDSGGSAYVTGVSSPDFPTTPGAFATTGSAFVTKLNATGTALVYSTFLGSGGGASIALDSSGNAYVTGSTQGNGFPTTSGAYDTSYNGGVDDAFVAKLNAFGSALVYSTFLGGRDLDYGYGIAVDSAGSAYVTGVTQAKSIPRGNFPTTSGAFDTTYNGSGDAFVSKFNAAGSGLVFSTFLGGNGDDGGRAIAVDSGGAAYVTGYTSSTSFPITPGAYDTSQNGSYDAFVTKLNATGSALVDSTFLGGSGTEQGHAIAVDSAGMAYVTGNVLSANFPTTAGAFDTSYGGGGYADGYVTRLTYAAPVTAASTPSHLRNEILTSAQLPPLLAAALARRQAVGVDTSGLGSIQLQVTNLGGRTLGMAAGHTIYFDDNAAGWGWFVDPTPWEDSEFTTPGSQGERNRMDLLTTLAHEMGHLLDYDRALDGVIIDTLPASIRRMASGTGVNDWALVDVLVSEHLSKRRH